MRGGWKPSAAGQEIGIAPSRWLIRILPNLRKNFWTPFTAASPIGLKRPMARVSPKLSPTRSPIPTAVTFATSCESGRGPAGRNRKEGTYLRLLNPKNRGISMERIKYYHASRRHEDDW